MQRVKKLTTLWIAFRIGVVALLISAPTLFAATEGSSDDEALFKKKLIEHKAHIELEAYQVQIFDNEVLPHSRRFIKGVQGQGEQAKVVIDDDLLSRFLAFHASKFSMVRPFPILAVVSAEPGCSRCTDALPEIMRLTEKRLVRRGFKVVFSDKDITLEELKKLPGSKSPKLPAELQGTDFAVWGVLLSQKIDVEHDQKLIEMSLVAEMGSALKFESVKVFGELDEVDQEASGLMTQAFTRGAQGGALAKKEGAEAPGARSLLVRVTKVPNFADIERIKKEVGAGLTQALGFPITMRERMVSENEIWLKAEGGQSFALAKERSIASARESSLLQAVAAGSTAELSWMDEGAQ